MRDDWGRVSALHQAIADVELDALSVVYGSLGTLTDDCDGNELVLKAIAEVKYAKQQFFVVPAGLRRENHFISRSVEDETSDDEFFLLFFNLDT